VVVRQRPVPLDDDEARKDQTRRDEARQRAVVRHAAPLEMHDERGHGRLRVRAAPLRRRTRLALRRRRRLGVGVVVGFLLRRRCFGDVVVGRRRFRVRVRRLDGVPGLVLFADICPSL